MELTLTKEFDEKGKEWIFLRKDGKFVDCFFPNQLERAKEKFEMLKESDAYPPPEIIMQYKANKTNLKDEIIDRLSAFKKDAEMALSDEWDKSDEGFKAQIQHGNELLERIKTEWP